MKYEGSIEHYNKVLARELLIHNKLKWWQLRKLHKSQTYINKISYLILDTLRNKPK